MVNVLNSNHKFPDKKWQTVQTQNQGFFQHFWEKTPGQNWEKMIDLTSKLEEINDIEHNKGSKIIINIKLF